LVEKTPGNTEWAALSASTMIIHGGKAAANAMTAAEEWLTK
jgi:hypothetical protein